ncbi:MAG: elongation factor P [Candidatus Paceibacterota bacterium]|jgi:elongation factor P
MSMLEYSDIKEKKVIIYEGEPYEVLTSHVFRKQQRKPVNATKLRNLISGRIVEYSFHVSEKAEEAELSRKQVKYLFTNKGEFWFCEANDPSKRFELPADVLGTPAKFLKTNMLVDALVFDEKIIGVKLPIKLEVKVTEAAPGIKGDTAKGGMKIVKIETGASIDAPLFVNEGDTLVINTETGEYVERVSK